MRIVLFDIAFAFCCGGAAMLTGLILDARNWPTWVTVGISVTLMVMLIIGAFSLGVWMNLSHYG